MQSIRPIKLRLSEKLSSPEYFEIFFETRTKDEVASQLRELRELRGLSQAKFAEQSGMKQSAVSRIEQAEYSGWTFKTLLRAAKTLNARLKIELVPAERVVAEYKARETRQQLSFQLGEWVDSAADIRAIQFTSNPVEVIKGKFSSESMSIPKIVGKFDQTLRVTDCVAGEGVRHG